MQVPACDVSVTFGSYATGIDRRAAAAVERLLGADPAVAQLGRSPFGIEGEYRLCVGTPSSTAAAQLFERLKLVLAQPVTAPVTLTGPTGSYSVPPAR